MMSNIIDPTNKSAFLYSERVSDRIKNICKPLTEYFGINGFGYLKIFKNSTYISLLNGFNNYHKKYFDNIVGQSEIFTKVSRDDVKYFIWPTNVSTDPIFSLLYEYNIWHGLTIHIKTKDYIEAFNFAFNKNSDDQSNFFLNNIETLNKFSKYFKIVAQDVIDCSDRSKLAIYKESVDPSFFLTHEKNKEKFFIFPLKESFNIRCKFSKRELECLNLLSNGKTAKEIGRILNLSPRTVESYIEHAKNKVGCNYKSQLIDTYLENKLIYNHE